MLIYCSNDFHFFLPSYDEAMRSRPAEPPPFDAVVNEGDGATQNETAGMCGFFVSPALNEAHRLLDLSVN